jgi:hypothetical protein
MRQARNDFRVLLTFSELPEGLPRSPSWRIPLSGVSFTRIKGETTAFA